MPTPSALRRGYWLGSRPMRQASSMTSNDPDPTDPMAGLGAFWYWLAILIFLFMGVFVVMALIQTHAQ
jgi:hypothetical protein